MSREEALDEYRVNARPRDAFDVFKIKDYIGPNPYLNRAALVFDFALTNYVDPLAVEAYTAAIAEHLPDLEIKPPPPSHDTAHHAAKRALDDYDQLFGQTVLETGKLGMNLHLDQLATYPQAEHTRIAVQALHVRTSRAIVYFVWDWFEAMTQGEAFAFDRELDRLQQMFRRSVYGGPTVYALLSNAYKRKIPTFYLWDEGLMQYGYGKQQVRGVATTFDRDSQLDSDFTTRKDDCKAFLERLGFPVPKGSIVTSFRGALNAARAIGYPVAVKPVIGHKGIGVTADVQDEVRLEFAFDQAVSAIAEDQPIEIIVEQSIAGADFRLLCVDGKFAAATERLPPFVVGDGKSTIAELIACENASAARLDTPTSAMGKIQLDAAMDDYLHEQQLSQDSILAADRTVYLRKVANLSAGGVSIDATASMHPDNIVLAQDIARHLRLTCLGIDAIAHDISKSWKDGDFAIIEINAAPGIYMHLRPAIGDSVDVPAKILDTFFESGDTARIPIITFNRISKVELQEVIDHILSRHPEWKVGAVCQATVCLNRAEKPRHYDYNTNVSNLLRDPKLDMLIVEYDSTTLETDGAFYEGSDMIVLDNPTETELTLTRDLLPDSTVILKEGDTISVRAKGLVEQYTLGASEPFKRVYLKQVSTIL